MNRRRFLTAAMAALALPAVVQAFEGEPTELEAVAAAFREAAATGKSLLVFVIPEDDGEKWRLGRAFGELLNHGSEEAQARMGAAVLVAARPEDLQAVVPSANDRTALMFAIDASRVPATAAPIHTRLPQDPSYDRDLDWDKRKALLDKALDARIRTLSGVVVSALPAAPDRDKALVHFRDTVLAEPVDGSHWARSGGCGTMVEGASRNVGVGCGMGHVNARSARVMYFFEVPS